MDAHVGKRSNAYAEFALNLSDLGGVFSHLGVISLYLGDPVSLPCLSQCAPALSYRKVASRVVVK